jgi:hypothetical protein
MLSTKKLTSITDELDLRGFRGGMTPVSLGTAFQVPEEVEEELPLTEPGKLVPVEIKALPPYRRVVALDGTSMVLGKGGDSIVGAVRGSIVERRPGEPGFKTQNYGPYLVCFTSQNRGEAYGRLRSKIFQLPKPRKVPNLGKMIDWTRTLLEKQLQLEMIKNYRNSLLLFDGSMTISMDSPRKYLLEMIDTAAENDNDLVSVSKHTTLTLKGTGRSILSPLEEVRGPCYCDVKSNLSVSPRRYMPIRIFTAKLSQKGEAFRIDMPVNSSKEPEALLCEVAGLAGAFGYPEELRVAHIACIFSSLEVLELQAAAVEKYDIELREEIREKIFGPWG